MPAGTDTYEIHKIKLGEEILCSGGSIRLRVWGTSMLPSVWPGDVVIVEGYAVTSVVCGDIILYEANDSFFVHRVIGKSEDGVGWFTRGDALPQDDPAITKSQLLGRVSVIYRNGRTIVPKRGLAPLMRAAGWILSNSDHLRSLALRLHSLRNRTRPDGVAHLARYF
ncbi:MAG: S24/S26 family peptidase [Terriglobales bacterium]